MALNYRQQGTPCYTIQNLKNIGYFLAVTTRIGKMTTYLPKPMIVDNKLELEVINDEKVFETIDLVVDENTFVKI